MVFCPVKGYRNRGFRFIQGYGENPEIYKQFGHKGHNGYDFAPTFPGTKGVVVYAPHDGYVKCIMSDPGYGNYVEVLSDPRGFGKVRIKSDLAHLASFLVPNGSFVAAGDPVGIMGSTGFSTGIHLHWTIKRTDQYGDTINKNNGFGGAIPIGPYIRLWDGTTLF